MERCVADTNIQFFTELLSGKHGKVEPEERMVIERLLVAEVETLARLVQNKSSAAKRA